MGASANARSSDTLPCSGSLHARSGKTPRRPDCPEGTGAVPWLIPLTNCSSRYPLPIEPSYWGNMCKDGQSDADRAHGSHSGSRQGSRSSRETVAASSASGPRKSRLREWGDDRATHSDADHLSRAVADSSRACIWRARFRSALCGQHDARSRRASKPPVLRCSPSRGLNGDNWRPHGRSLTRRPAFVVPRPGIPRERGQSPAPIGDGYPSPKAHGPVESPQNRQCVLPCSCPPLAMASAVTKVQ
jgi:hypothetical protein